MKLMKTLISSLILGGALFASSSFAMEKATETLAAQTESVEKVAAEKVEDKLNINTATASEIQKALTGIGAKKAEAIVQYREKHGNFTHAEQLLEVQGIGKATLEKNRDRLTF
ncbi:helix-hairpin-helix domain-containing protein [Rodentibacter trehalosifermentans]|uniref:Competence protein ComE n=1 Tax=Rodentibacter trehalosifermentans TaxID=1908263 RepID=A0A1V3J4T8_9PAST|nr:helix-hairpin-helix domain-containing protein [Rodentibacter trehalosifermentans]OOF45885.1 competence protein ComE [Rodentibacter trehalosifermentans]OOF50199.1 competence protein ComE [Rodentibacter trehalosifermentans]OOF52937.1 competence protein ComE [Rodentibacter trehalosifermentans]